MGTLLPNCADFRSAPTASATRVRAWWLPLSQQWTRELASSTATSAICRSEGDNSGNALMPGRRRCGVPCGADRERGFPGAESPSQRLPDGRVGHPRRRCRTDILRSRNADHGSSWVRAGAACPPCNANRLDSPSVPTGCQDSDHAPCLRSDSFAQPWALDKRHDPFGCATELQEHRARHRGWRILRFNCPTLGARQHVKWHEAIPLGVKAR